MKPEAIDLERRIVEALKAFESGHYTTLSKVAEFWDVPYRKLLSRRNGAQPKSMNGGINKKLSKEQEEALIVWLERQHRFGFPAHYDLIEQAANRLLRLGNSSEDDPPVVGTRWASNFVLRYPQFAAKKSRPLEVERFAAHDPVLLAEWFEKYDAVVKEEGIAEGDRYNMDETGFFAGMARKTLVIVPKGERAAYLKDPNNRDWITAVEAISADGYAPPPLIILKGSIHQAAWYETSSPLPNDYAIGLSDSGYINSELAMKWLERFERATRKRTQGNSRLLILDGHESHVTVDFIAYCHDHDILPMCLPPHTTHLLQPLDLVIFRSMKHWQSRAVDLATRLFKDSFSKMDFLDTYPGVRSAALSPKNISSAWKAAGLVPFDPDVVLSKIESAPASKEVSPPPSNPTLTTMNPLATPSNPKEILRQSQYLQEFLEGDAPLSIGKRVAMRKLLGQKRREILKGEHALEELEAIHEASKRVSRRKKNAKRWQLQRGGVLGLDEGRELLQERTVIELDKQKRAEVRYNKKHSRLLTCIAKAAIKGHREMSEKHAFRMLFRRNVALEAAAKGMQKQAKWGS
jgi:DDE superfamily endonuclease/Tc5 transposase DNA-binding domain